MRSAGDPNRLFLLACLGVLLIAEDMGHYDIVCSKRKVDLIRNETPILMFLTEYRKLFKKNIIYKVRLTELTYRPNQTVLVSWAQYRHTSPDVSLLELD